MSSIGTVCCNFLDDFQNKTGENTELFFIFFLNPDMISRKCSPVKQEIKKVWPYSKYVFVNKLSKYVFVNIITLFLRLLAALISFLT